MDYSVMKNIKKARREFKERPLKKAVTFVTGKANSITGVI
jgi:hypothetical protein